MSNKESETEETTAVGTRPVEKTEAVAGPARNLELILDITLQVAVELGRGQIMVQELLQLAQGSVVALTKLAGEPLDILVNNKLIARGEAVVVNEKFGVRLTDIISPAERIEHLAGGAGSESWSKE